MGFSELLLTLSEFFSESLYHEICMTWFVLTQGALAPWLTPVYYIGSTLSIFKVRPYEFKTKLIRFPLKLD